MYGLRKADHVRNQQRVLEFAAKNPDFTPVEIATSLSISVATVHRVLKANNKTFSRISIYAVGKKLRKTLPTTVKFN